MIENMREKMKKLKSTGRIKKISKKGLIKRQEKKELLISDFEFYQKIWECNEHYCTECGIGLPEPALTLYFHHLLPKRNYPEYRHLDKNICILCGNCHSMCESNIDKTPKVRKLTEDLREELGLN